jgi:hypothetical protein
VFCSVARAFRGPGRVLHRVSSAFRNLVFASTPPQYLSEALGESSTASPEGRQTRSPGASALGIDAPTHPKSPVRGGIKNPEMKFLEERTTDEGIQDSYPGASLPPLQGSQDMGIGAFPGLTPLGYGSTALQARG